MKKENLKMEAWLKEVAPSDALRRWFAHDPLKWRDFQKRYRRELENHPETWKPILEVAQKKNVTLLFSARDTEHNNALVLKSCLEQQMRKR